MLHSESLPNHQGIYTPLSQAMTDSESDEEIEIHNANKHRQQTQLQLQQQQQRNRSRVPPNTLALKSPHTRPTATRIVGGAQLKQQKPAQQQQQSQQVNGNGSSNSSSYTTNMQNTFRSVMLSDLGSTGGSNVGVEFSNFGGEYDTSGDNVAILGTQADESKRTPMSTKRRCCFIASLLLCLVAVLGFVWVIPCGNPDGTGACPAPVDRPKTHTWFKNYTKIELRGGINVVAGPRAWENNLIFLYRGDVFYTEYRPNNPKRNGIISLIGSTGAVAWYDATVDEPVAIDCTLLDVDANGKPDCLVLDDHGELGAINSASGQWHWHFRERSAHKLDAYDFPLILPDIDGDDVLDILLISSLTLEQRTKTFVQQQQQPGSVTATLLEARNVLRLLSGRRGTSIGDGFRMHDCTKLAQLHLEGSVGDSRGGVASAATLNISYTCWRNNTDQVQRSKTLAELYALITNKSLVGRRLLPASKISQHRRVGPRKEPESQRNVYLLSGRELVIENRGKCPNCNVTLQLSETRDGRRDVLHNVTEMRTFGMEPAQWHFKNTKSNMSGFVLKFWKWEHMANPKQSQSTNSVDKSHNYTNSSSTSASSSTASAKNMNGIREKDKFKDKSYSKTQQQPQPLPKKQPQQRRKRHSLPDGMDESVTFEQMEKRETLKDKSKFTAAQPQMIKNYKMQMITESILLVVFMGGDTRIKNTSLRNIIQFCRSERNEMICQPDVQNQENSMLIADLDTDGSQELVSYMSTYVADDQYPYKNWYLTSYVRLDRIQSDMPTVYDQDKFK